MTGAAVLYAPIGMWLSQSIVGVNLLFDSGLDKKYCMIFR